MPRTAFTGLCQVNLDNENTRIVVREVRKLSEPHLGTSLPDAEMGSRAVHTDSARHGSSVKTTKTRPDAP